MCNIWTCAHHMSVQITIIGALLSTAIASFIHMQRATLCCTSVTIIVLYNNIGSTSSTQSLSSSMLTFTPIPTLPPPGISHHIYKYLTHEIIIALPSIVESPTSQNILIQTGKESLILLCSVTGERVMIFWQRNGLNVSTTSEDITISISSNANQLLIHNISKHHEGSYHCIASNAAGTVTSAMATIHVTGIQSAL